MSTKSDVQDWLEEIRDNRKEEWLKLLASAEDRVDNAIRKLTEAHDERDAVYYDMGLAMEPILLEIARMRLVLSPGNEEVARIDMVKPVVYNRELRVTVLPYDADERNICSIRLVVPIDYMDDPEWRQKYLKTCIDRDETWAERYCEDMECLL